MPEEIEAINEWVILQFKHKNGNWIKRTKNSTVRKIILRQKKSTELKGIIKLKKLKEWKKLLYDYVCNCILTIVYKGNWGYM